MRKTVMKLRYICDVCRTVADVETTDSYERPAGWGTRKQHDCGLTGYTRTMDVCKVCMDRGPIADES